MERIPESVELMVDVEQAHAYGTADLSRFNGALIDAFGLHFGEFSTGHVLDLGCGTADITIRFARAYPETMLLGIDGSPSMLELGQSYLRKSGLETRIELRRGYLPNAGLEAHAFDAVVANSLLHHLAEPADLWRTVRRCARPGSPVMVVDLIRPDGPEEAHALVEKYAQRGHPRVKQDLFNSLCAAYTVEDVRGQLDEAGLAQMQVEAMNELQLKVWGLSN